MASKEQLLQKQNNVSKILAQIREKGAVSRMELCDGLSLSWACVSDLVSEMITLGLVEERRTVACGKGRVPTILQLNESKLFVGIDAHDTGMSASICDLYGNKKCNVQISENLNGLSLLDKVKTVLSTVFSQNRGIIGVGIAMQGVYDKKSEQWILGEQVIDDKSFCESVANEFGVPVITEHDPNCMLFGFLDLIAEKSLMMVRIDNGIGVSVYKNGRFFSDGSLELGHVVIDRNGTRLSQVVCKSQSEQEMQTAIQALAIALANVSALITVEKIVLCGAKVKNFRQFFSEIQKTYDAVVMPYCKAQLQIIEGESASEGASRLAVVKYPCYDKE